MIIDVWKPIFTGSNKKRKIIRYDIVSMDCLIIEKKTGYKVRYICDHCKDDTIHTTVSSSLIDSLWNGISLQMCRKCRSRKSEYEIKKTQVKWSIIVDSFESSMYKILTKSEEYDIADKKSQFNIESICESGHKYKCTWNNWKKGKRCRHCYTEKVTNNSIKNKDGYQLYYFLVWRYTNKNYRKFKNIINPMNLERGINKYQLDHKFSISEGMRRGIPPHIIGSAYNLEMLKYSINSSKGGKCSISEDDLFSNYTIF